MSKKKKVNYGNYGFQNEVVMRTRKAARHTPRSEKRAKSKLRREIQDAC